MSEAARDEGHEAGRRMGAPERSGDELLALARAAGGPIVEPDPGGGAQVTFVWDGAPETTAVSVATWIGPNVFGSPLDRVEGSSVWAVTLPARPGLRTAYQFLVDHEALSLDAVASMADEELAAASAERVAHLYADPLNPATWRPQWWHRDLAADRFESVLALPDAPPRPWLDTIATGGGRGTVESHKVGDRGRLVYSYLPAGYDEATTYPLVVLLDGRLFRHVAPAPAVFDHLIERGVLPPVVALLVEASAPERRTAEFFADEAFAEEIVASVIPWAAARWSITTDPSRTVIGGASAGGFAASFLALRHPERFGRVLSMSGSYWWGAALDGEPEWLTRQYAEAPASPATRFYVDVGCYETMPIRDAPGVTMVSANRHFRTVLRARGFDVVDYVEFAGGHEAVAWADSVARALPPLLA
ncbi:MAG TPA: alpha/beta hydrolase-fold protein [Acidimicrobiales bacterium]|nr:alpha/beta hydrolase-fold protein [Acidimicrobiales bacterium]